MFRRQGFKRRNGPDGDAGSRSPLSVTCALAVGLACFSSSAEPVERAVACGPRLEWTLPPALSPGAHPDVPLRQLCPEGQVPLPVERYGLKGHPGQRGVFTSKQGSTTVSATFHYSGVAQFFSLSGASAQWGQFQPTLAPLDSHSLAEMSVESEDGTQIVEVGWTVDRRVNGDSLPHLFVFHWVDGKAGCYNGCGWQQVSYTRYPGMVVTLTREPQEVRFLYFNAGWWVWYQSEWIGFFPGALWTVDFSTAGLVQWFGEVAGEAQPKSQMGDGLLPSQVDAAFMVNLEVEDASGVSQAASVSPNVVTDPQVYQLNLTDGGFSLGGPGYFNVAAQCETCASLLANCGVVDDGCGNALPCGTCIAPEMCGGDGQVNVCLLSDGGMGGLPWGGAYFDGGASGAGDAGTPATAGANGTSGCSSSGSTGSLLLVALTLGLLVPRRLFAGR